MLRITLVLVTLAASAPLLAANAQTQLDLNQQATRTLALANNDLYERREKIAAGLTPPAAASFEMAQRAWVNYREAQCAFEGMSSVGGSVHGMVVTNCKTRLTQERLKALDAQAKCPEGDVACIRR